MAKLSKIEKKSITDRLDHAYASVKLQCDNDLVTLKMERKSQKSVSYGVMVYVNNVFKGIWLSEDSTHEETKYMYSKEKYILSEPKRKAFLKTMGKKWCDEKQVNQKVIIRSCFFPSPTSAINHLCKVCDTIKIIESNI